MIKVDVSQLGDLNDRIKVVCDGFDELEGYYENADNLEADLGWKGEAHESYRTAFQYVRTYTNDVKTSYENVITAITELISNTDSFVGESPSVKQLEE